MQRICPNCDCKLREYNYFFCSECGFELPQELIKKSQNIYLNTKLKVELIPDIKFLFFTIPYENRNSMVILKFLLSLSLIILMILLSISIWISYN
jgi:predicted amidophosphoribosyltransferase